MPFFSEKTRKFLGNIVYSAYIPWVTPQYSLYSKICAFNCTEPFYSCYCVSRTGGVKTAAGGFQRRYALLINLYQKKYNIFHPVLPPADRHFLILLSPFPVRNFCSSVERISHIAALATITMSIPSGRNSSASLYAARITLFARFLCTAPPTFLPAVMPSLLHFSLFFRTYMTT